MGDPRPLGCIAPHMHGLSGHWFPLGCHPLVALCSIAHTEGSAFCWESEAQAATCGAGAQSAPRPSMQSDLVPSHYPVTVGVAQAGFRGPNTSWIAPCQATGTVS